MLEDKRQKKMLGMFVILIIGAGGFYFLNQKSNVVENIPQTQKQRKKREVPNNTRISKKKRQTSKIAERSERIRNEKKEY